MNVKFLSGVMRLRTGVLLMAVAAALFVIGGPVALRAQTGPTLVIRAPKKVDRGQPISIELNMKNARDVAGYEMNVLYDTSAAHYYGLHQLNNGLKSQGRDIVDLIANREDNGGMAIGLASCPVSSCVTGQGARHEQGGTGNFKLATLLIGTDQAGTLEIKFDAEKFVDAQGKPVAVSLSTHSIKVQVANGGKAFPAPASLWQLSTRVPITPSNADLQVTGHKQVTHADLMEVAFAWTTMRQAAAPCKNLPSPALDVNRDGCIDVADVQLVAAQVQPKPAQSTAPTAGATFVVNTTLDSGDINVGDGICLANNGACTLRAAIQEADLQAGPTTIKFNIPGGGVQTINLKTQLPTISNSGTIIDGYTQPGSSVNTDPFASNAVITVQLAGQGASAFDAMHISSDNNVIRGLAFYNLKASFYIFGAGAFNNLLAGNFIGTDSAGQFQASTTVVGASGVYLDVGANNNHVGTSALADRNVISGNARMGISTYSEGTNNNVFQNNIIGLSPRGDRRVRNFKHGIDINNASSANLIGGTGLKEGNLISGDGDPSDNDPSGGVEISHDTLTVQNKILGNCFGTDITCTTKTSYSYLQHYGIRFEDGVNNNEAAFNVIGNANLVGVNFDAYYADNNWVHDNRIGISPTGANIGNGIYGVRDKYHAQHNKIGPNNIITNNQTGVLIEYIDEDYNTITRNSIYGNSYMGIDLGPHFGVTYNDPGDTDTGANEELNFPVITSATATQVSGTACGDAIVPKPCTIEIFIAQPDPNNDGGGLYGQGKTFVGTGTSNGSFTINVSGVQVGDWLTATATDAQGNTSEFSKNVQAAASTGPTPTPTTVPPTPTPGPTATPTPTGPTTFAKDSFSRTATNGWGVADLGGSYSLSGPPSNFNVNGSQGTISVPVTNTVRTAFLFNATARGVDAKVRVKVDKVAQNGAEIAYLVLRHVNTSSDYLTRLRFAPDGSVRVLAATEINGVTTNLGGEKLLSGVTQQANQFYWLRAQVIGVNPTTINIKAWVDGQSEPGAWLYTITDSTAALQTAGSVGLRAYVATAATNTPVLFSFDDWLVTSP